MHAMIPLAKNLPCIKISLPLKSEASLAVYSHHVCSIVVLDDMGMTATFKKTTHTHSLHALPVPTCHIDMISMLNIAKNLLIVLLLSLQFINLHIMYNVNLSVRSWLILLDKVSSVTVKMPSCFPKLTLIIQIPIF